MGALKIEWKNEQWAKDMSRYMSDWKDEYFRIGYSCSQPVSNRMLVSDLSRRMKNRDGNMLLNMFDDFSECIFDNMPMLAHTEIGTYIDASEMYIEDDDCYELISRAILSAADAELGYGQDESELMQWMRWMFLVPTA